MIKTLKWYENLNQTHEFFSPASAITKDGIITASNLKQLRIGNIIKFKADSEDYELALTFNPNNHRCFNFNKQRIKKNKYEFDQ